MSNVLLEDIFSVAFEKTVPHKKTIAEATMNDIPHEIDDVVHKLKDLRFDMEELIKTWEKANMDLVPLHEILNGINSLIEVVYNNGAKLADQQIGVVSKESALKEVDSENNNPDVVNNSNEQNKDNDNWKIIELSDVLDMLKQPEHEMLNRAFKRGVRNVREDRPVGVSGEIETVFISPDENLKIMFKGLAEPIFIYKDGGISGSAWRKLK